MEYIEMLNEVSKEAMEYIENDVCDDNELSVITFMAECDVCHLEFNEYDLIDANGIIDDIELCCVSCFSSIIEEE